MNAKTNGTAVLTPSALLDEVQPLLSILDTMQARILVADMDLNIVYANPFALATLASLEKHILDAFGVPVSEILHGSIHRFHKDPARVERALADLATFPREVSFAFGPVTITTQINLIREGREVLGYTVIFADVTAAKAQAAESERLSLETAEMATDAKAVNQVMSTIGSAASPEEAVRLVLDTVRSAFGWAYGSYWKVDPADNALHFALESGDAGAEFRAVTLSATFREGVGLSGRAWRNRDLFFTRDIGEMTDCVRAPVAQRAGVKSGVCFPIIVDGAVVGTMDFFATETLDPSPGRLDALRSVGNLVSQGLQRLAGQERDRRTATDTQAVSEVMASLAGATTPDAALRGALDTVRSAFGWAYGSYWKVDPSDNALHFGVESGDAGPEFRAVTLAATFREGVGLSGRAWRNRDLFFTRDIGEMTDCVRAPVAQRAGVKSGVCFPIIVDGAVVGTMDFFATETLDPSPGRLDALRSVGNLVSQSLQRLSAAERESIAAAELRAKVDSMLVSLAGAAGGDLTVAVTVEGDDAVGQMGTALKKLLGDLRISVSSIASNSEALAAAAEELQVVSEQMGANSAETSNQVNLVSEASVEVSRNVETVSTGAEEMSASIKEIAKNASDAAKVAGQAVDAAQATNETVAKLGQSSAEIGQIVKVITGIAQQTNLLALNATIEAARAGEAGKGFAVVANEVKELAKETAKATEDISQKIEAIQSDTARSVDAIAGILTIINQIAEYQDTIASAVEEQAATTSEMARSVNDASRGSTEITANMQAVADAADSTASGASDSQRAATELARMSADLQALVGQFTY